MIDRSREAQAFLTSAVQARPDAVSACAGWTTHDILAHIAGGAAEVRRHLEPYLHGDPVPPTRSFDEREAPLRALDHDTLLDRLTTEDQALRTVLGDVLEREPDAVIAWTGRPITVATFLPHVRNEYALHRWDIVGDDDTSLELLVDPDLIEHSVGVLGQALLAAGHAHDPHPETDFHVRLRATNQRDLRVSVENSQTSLSWADDDHDEPSVDLDAAARLLFIWGRRPDNHNQIHSHLPQPDLARLQALLSGY